MVYGMMVMNHKDNTLSGMGLIDSVISYSGMVLFVWGTCFIPSGGDMSMTQLGLV